MRTQKKHTQWIEAEKDIPNEVNLKERIRKRNEKQRERDGERERERYYPTVPEPQTFDVNNETSLCLPFHRNVSHSYNNTVLRKISVDKENKMQSLCPEIETNDMKLKTNKETPAKVLTHSHTFTRKRFVSHTCTECMRPTIYYIQCTCWAICLRRWRHLRNGKTLLVCCANVQYWHSQIDFITYALQSMLEF